MSDQVITVRCAFLRISVSSTSSGRRRYSRAPNSSAWRFVTLIFRCGGISLRRMLRFDGGRPLILTQSRTSVTKAVLKPFLVMISAAGLLWCAAMAIHLAKAEVPTSIG